MSSQSSEQPSLASNATVINIIPYSENQGTSNMKENYINKKENKLNGQRIKDRSEIAQAINNDMNVINIIGYRVNNRDREPDVENQQGNKDAHKLGEIKNTNQVESHEWGKNNIEITNGII